MSVALSECGHLVAHTEGTSISIHSILPEIQLRHYNCTKDILKHLSVSIANEVVFKVEDVYWESVDAFNKSTKLAVSVSSKTFSAALIYDITKTGDPIIIELESPISRVSWILGAPEEGSAYKNCTQLVLFDKYGLLARVYSLDCTRVLFTVPKPIVLSVIARPKHPEFWSLLLTSYYDKNLTSRSILIDLQSDSRPYLLHFNNIFSRSALPTSLEMDHQPSPSAQITWDPEGRWLCFFDSGDTLFGYSVRVYNCLGLYKRSGSLNEGHLALPILHSTHTKGIGWTFSWLNIENLLFIAALPSRSNRKIDLRVHGVSHLSHCYPAAVDLEQTDTIWVYEDFDGEGSYRRTDTLPEAEFEWRTIRDSKAHLVLATGSVIVIIRRTSHGPLVKFEPEAYISSLRFKDIHFYENSITLLFRDHVAVYEAGNLSILAKSRYSLVSMKVTETSEARTISLVEQTPQGHTWRQIGLEPNHDDTMLILNKTSYREDSSKVVNLVKEVEKNEWGRAARRRLTEDTDTFKLNFKRRRPPGLPELH